MPLLAIAIATHSSSAARITHRASRAHRDTPLI
jgi:hypothetical protein